MEQARAAGRLFDSAALDNLKLRLTPTVVAEAFCVLTSFYGMERPEAAEVLALLVRQPSLVVEERRAIYGRAAGRLLVWRAGPSADSDDDIHLRPRLRRAVARRRRRLRT